MENGSEESNQVVIGDDEDPENELRGIRVENGREESSQVENGNEESSQVENGDDEDPENELLGSQVENGGEQSSHPAKQTVYVVACSIVAVCMDSLFLYIPFLTHSKICLGINTELWKVAVALRTVADFFTALILLPQLRGCMSSIKLILLMCVKYLALAPIPQILISEKFILKTLGGYPFWNLILFCLYGTRLVLIFQSCERLKTRVSAPVYLFLYFIVSHLIGASWNYLSIKRQLSCWRHACIGNGCVNRISNCDDIILLNSTLVNEFCPINPPNATVFDYGIYLDALQSGIVEDKGVLIRFLQCFFWGLRNLSSFASNLKPSMNVGEILFAIIIGAVALILFIYILEPISKHIVFRTEEGTSAPGEIELVNIFTD